MPIFLQEDSKELNKQTYHLSKQGKQKLQAAITQMEALGLENQDGYKMLKHLQDEDYNQAKKKDDGKVVEDENVHTEADKPQEPEKGILNKTVEGGIHRNKEQTNKITHHFTDWVYGINGELTLKHKNAQNRTKNINTKNLVPKTKKVPKPKVQKPIQAKDGSQIHIMKEEKIIFSKKQIKMLNEQMKKI